MSVNKKYSIILAQLSIGKKFTKQYTHKNQLSHSRTTCSCEIQTVNVGRME